MKKIVIAPDSFKGSLSAAQVCDIVAEAALAQFPHLQVVRLPIADGGEGLVEALLYGLQGDRNTPGIGGASTPGIGGASTPGIGGASTPSIGGASTPAGDRNIPVGDRNIPAGDRNIPAGDRNIPAGDRNIPVGDRVRLPVQDPLGREIVAQYAVLADGRAVIEMSGASGLPLLREDEKDVLRASTYGTGQLIADALRRGCREIILGLGGSATNDGGAGLAAALGIRYLDEDGGTILCGGDLPRLARIDPAQRLPEFDQAHFTLACDVTNPLHGPQGAAAVYAPQKGASRQQVALLDGGLRRLAALIQRDTGLDLQAVPGSGAAGGMAVPFLAFGRAELRRGLDLVLEMLDFERHLQDCDLVITGEGCTDEQSSMGKVIAGIGRRAQARNIPVIVLSGALQGDLRGLYAEGITAMFATCREVAPLETALRNAADNLRSTAGDIFRLLRAARGG